MRLLNPPGRWVWILAGLLTAAALIIPGTRLLAAAGHEWHVYSPPASNVSVHATPTSAP
jgi:hypothetical protein